MRRIHLIAASPLMFLFLVAAPVLLADVSAAQSAPYERTFSQSKAAVEKTVRQLQPSASGRLPTLDGFTRPGDRPLDRFQRGYYQCAVQVTASPSGGTTVRVSAKITAWYADPAAAKSGYQELPSNGRLETDFLDRLEDALGSSVTSPAANAPMSSPSSQAKSKSAASAPTISAPQPSDASSGIPLASSKAMPENSPFKVGNPVNSDLAASLATQKAVADKRMDDLTKEAKGLEEILRNQAHPNNLVAVKKSGTPVLGNPIEGAKVLFLASAEDEFEILDTNANWVHIRISGLSRGWIRRAGVEMPSSSASEAKVENAPAQANTENFQVKNEEIASFPGTWEPLRGKTVKILTVQNSAGTAGTGSRAKLEFAKSLFDKEYSELTQAPTTAAGVVLIFDSEDGGMAAATLPTLQQWKAGSLSDQAFWRRCFLDPPETFSLQTAQ
jgi:hypothetical protein